MMQASSAGPNVKKLQPESIPQSEEHSMAVLAEVNVESSPPRHSPGTKQPIALSKNI